MTRKTFLRRDSVRYSKLGKNRKKLQKWRKPKGRDNQMRLKRKGYPALPSIGYKKQSIKQAPMVYNLNDLNKLEKNSSIIIASIGAKKKLDIIKKAQEMKIKILNIKEDKKWN